MVECSRYADYQTKTYGNGDNEDLEIRPYKPYWGTDLEILTSLQKFYPFVGVVGTVFDYHEIQTPFQCLHTQVSNSGAVSVFR